MPGPHPRRPRSALGRLALPPLTASVALHATVVLVGAALAVGSLGERGAPTLRVDVTAPVPRVEEPDPTPEAVLDVARAAADAPEFPAPDPFEAPPLLDAPPVVVNAPVDPLAADARLPHRRRPANVPSAAAPAPSAAPTPTVPTAPGPESTATRAPAPTPTAAPAPFVAAASLPGNAFPRYPRIAERRGWTGVVTLAIRVGADGAVTDVEVLESSGRDVLDEAAIETVQSWRYRPATEGGRAVATRIRQPIRFTR